MPPAARISRSALSAKLLRPVTISCKMEVLIETPVATAVPEAVIVIVTLPRSREICSPDMVVELKVSTGCSGSGRRLRWALVPIISLARKTIELGAVRIVGFGVAVGVGVGVTVTVTVAPGVTVTDGTALGAGVAVAVSPGVGVARGGGVGEGVGVGVGGSTVGVGVGVR